MPAQMRSGGLLRVVGPQGKSDRVPRQVRFAVKQQKREQRQRSRWRDEFMRPAACEEARLAEQVDPESLDRGRRLQQRHRTQALLRLRPGFFPSGSNAAVGRYEIGQGAEFREVVARARRDVLDRAPPVRGLLAAPLVPDANDEEVLDPRRVALHLASIRGLRRTSVQDAPGMVLIRRQPRSAAGRTRRRMRLL